MSIESKIPKDIFLINGDMWWSKDDIGAYEYFLTYDAGFIDYIKPHLDNTRVCVQAGGHCGWMTRELDKIFDYIYTFEPNPLEFTALCMNMPGDNIFKFNACIGNEHKCVSMTSAPTQSGAGYVDGEGKIPTFLIDDMNLDICDYIQLDLEGYEYFALQGAEKTIERLHPVLCIERYWGHRYNITNEILESFLNKHGYKFIGRMDSDHFYKV
jgi:FkbM family methyltransferase